MTPVFGHGALRLYLLSLLDEAPRHGYELMQALEHRFGGTYSPSAGTIYPRLAKLEEEGHVTKSADGRRTTYAITDAGRAELHRREGELHALEEEITDSVRRLASDVREGVQAAMQTLRAELAAAEREARSGARRSDRSSDAGQAAALSVPNPSAPGPSAAVPSPPEPRGASDGVDDVAAHPTDEPSGRSRAAKTASRLAAHDVDLALSDFRQRVRSAVRRDRGGAMSEAQAAAVRRELDAALQRIERLL